MHGAKVNIGTNKVKLNFICLNRRREVTEFRKGRQLGYPDYLLPSSVNIVSKYMKFATFSTDFSNIL